MGTRGYIVVKYNKKYYYRYNHSDSYPEHLGKNLVEYLKYNCTLKEGEEEQYKEHILSLADSNLTYITLEKPDTTHMIEWVYIIDLENMTLEILGGYYTPVYKLDDILNIVCECHDHDCEEEACGHVCEDEDCDCYHHLCVEKEWYTDFHKKNEQASRK